MANMTRRNLLGLATGAATVLLVGCGGGGSGSGLATTRKRVVAIDGALGSRSQFDPLTILTANLGVSSAGTMSDGLGSFLGSNGLPPPGFASPGYSTASAAATRAATVGSATRTATSGFAYDAYLQLWAQQTTTDTEDRYDFFVDEAKAQPGGFVSSVHPAWTYGIGGGGGILPPEKIEPNAIGPLPPFQPSFPIVYRTEYAFTAGTLSGSHGLSENTTEADYSYTSKYENFYADGWKDSGSNQSDSGGSNWSARIDAPDGKFAEAAGSFRGGVGGSRLSSSDGTKATYQFTASGSGHGTIEGPGAGLPVTVSWDASGNVLARYADGTTETFSRYGGPIPVDSGVGTGATAKAN